VEGLVAKRRKEKSREAKVKRTERRGHKSPVEVRYGVMRASARPRSEMSDTGKKAGYD
jgi:hypothetical protein